MWLIRYLVNASLLNYNIQLLSKIIAMVARPNQDYKLSN